MSDVITIAIFSDTFRILEYSTFISAEVSRCGHVFPESPEAVGNQSLEKLTASGWNFILFVVAVESVN